MPIDGERIKGFILANLKTLIAAAGLTLAVFGSIANLYAQIKTQETEINNLKKNGEVKESLDREFRTVIRQEQREIKQQLVRQNEKLDKLIDIKLRELERRQAR